MKYIHYEIRCIYRSRISSAILLLEKQRAVQLRAVTECRRELRTCGRW